MALVIGRPIGVGLGRVIWRTSAGQLGVDPSPTTPVAALLIAEPATILLANLIAAGPALIGARTLRAEALRPE